MNRVLLAGLNEARAAKKRVCLARNLEDHTNHLIVEGDGPKSLVARVGDAYRLDKSIIVEIDGERWFLQIFNPPLRLMIVGAVHIGQALAPMARIAGYDVTIIDPRSAFANEIRFPDVRVICEWPDDALEELEPDRRSAIVTLTHDPKIDDLGLDAALKSDAFYIAALGSKRTHGGRISRLKELGYMDDALVRIHGPAGSDIGAVSPAEIAISVMAEMTRVLRRADTFREKGTHDRACHG